MAANAYRETAAPPPGEMSPLDLQLDLLVDGELPENQRQALLLAIEAHAKGEGQWRSLALRFLQRQTEQQTVRALMAGGNVIPAELMPRLHGGRGVIGRVGWIPLMATAAGLLIAVTSVMITLYVVRPPGSAPLPAMAGEFHTSLPRDLTASDTAVPVSVPMLRAENGAMLFPVSTENDGAKKTVIIQSDGRDGFIMIPVSTSKTKVY